MQILLDFSGAYFRCSWQINHLNTFIFKKVKLSFPIIAHNKGIYVILVHISLFLFPVFFWYNQIHISYSLKQLFSNLVWEITLLAFLVPIELIC